MPTFLETLARRETAQEQIQALLLEREERCLQALESEEKFRRLLEQEPWDTADPQSSGSVARAGLGSAANDLMAYGAAGFETARPGARQHGDMPPFYRTEQHHWQLVDAARVMEALCPTAVCILDVLTQFVIFTGFTYKVVPVDKGKSEPLVAKAQKLLDRWMRIVNWCSWEKELFRRSRRDGAGILILEPQEEHDDLLIPRSVEPEQVREPMHAGDIKARLGVRSDTSWKYGILTSRNDTSIARGYWVVSQYSDGQNRGEFYRPDEVFHLKTEWVDRQAKRGISDFFSVGNDIPRVRKLLRALCEGGVVQAHIAYIREHPEGMMPARLGENAEANNTSRHGNRVPAAYMDGPTVLDVPFGLRYEAGPLATAGRSDVLIKVLQAGLRNIGARWQMPEGVVSGDASNANLASALVAEGPFCRSLQSRQWHYRNAYEALLERVLDHAAVTGHLGGARENVLDEIEVAVECPPVAVRKLKEETERNAVLNERGVLSPQTWSAREDLDHDDEQANFAECPPVEPVEETAITTVPEGERI